MPGRMGAQRCATQPINYRCTFFMCVMYSWYLHPLCTVVHHHILVKVTCSVWRSIQCFWISRIKFSHMFPLPSFSCRTPCCLAFVPVENAYTTLCGNVLSTNWLVQIINVNHSHFKWEGLLLLTFWRQGCTAILWRSGYRGWATVFMLFL